MEKNDFLWGTASSGPQSEGSINKPLDSIWETWYKKEPERFHNFIGPDKTSNVYNKYKEDIKLMKEIGLNSFRTSIQWTRIFKDIENGEIDKDGIDFYINYFKEIKKHNINLIVNLFHYDLPTILFDKYEGFKSQETIDYFVEYAKVCFEYFGEFVDKWSTFNEPMAYVKESYLDNRIYPCELDFNSYIKVNYNILIAHKKVVLEFKKSSLNSEMGIILDCLVPIPRSNNELDIKASKIADLLINRIYLDPCILGELPKDYYDFIKDNNVELEISKEDEKLIKDNIVDFVGCNYYRPLRVKASTLFKFPGTPITLDHFYENYLLPNGRINKHRGWEIYTKGLYDIGIRIKNEYNNIPWYVSENGMGVEGEEKYRKNGIIEDDYRIEFLEEHLKWLKKAKDEGSNCFGYHMWTFVDNWSWLNAYKNRYGFVEYDLEKDKRTRKKSSYWMEEYIKKGAYNEKK